MRRHYIAAVAPRAADFFVKSEKNQLVHALSRSGYEVWSESNVEVTREEGRYERVRASGVGVV
jgi:hypothetical protein